MSESKWWAVTFIVLDVAFVLVLTHLACTPLRVSHPERWNPDYGVTEYPARAITDAGAKD